MLQELGISRTLLPLLPFKRRGISEGGGRQSGLDRDAHGRWSSCIILVTALPYLAWSCCVAS